MLISVVGVVTEVCIEEVDRRRYCFDKVLGCVARCDVPPSVALEQTLDAFVAIEEGERLRTVMSGRVALFGRACGSAAGL